MAFRPRKPRPNDDTDNNGQPDGNTLWHAAHFLDDPTAFAVAARPSIARAAAPSNPSTTVAAPTTAAPVTNDLAAGNAELAAPTAAAPQTSVIVRAAAKGGPLSILDYGLQALYLGGPATAALSAPVGGLSVAHAPNAISANGQYVTIDATAADGNGATLLAQLQAIGLQGGASFKGMASGLLPVDKVGALLGVADLAHARESGMITHAGLVTSQADVSMHADTARSTFGVSGAGIKVGVLSDSFATRAAPVTTMAQDIANGDLPANTTILQDFAGGTDEGRAMAQIIHDSAPGAAILFATAFGGQANFANNIIALNNAGAQVIVDDVFYFYEPAFQDGVIAQAVDQVVANGATYFSSAGNEGHAGYESRFINGGTGTLGGFTETFHNFGTTVGGVASTLLQITQTRTTTYVFQWANAAASASPGVGAISDLDFAGYTDAAGANEIFAFTSVEINGDPINDLTLTGAQTFYLRVGLFQGPAPAALKIVAFDDDVTFGANITNINDGTTSGHNSAAGAIAVGAADYRQTPAFGVGVPVVETFSSGGPTNIWVDNAGNILPAPQVRIAPSITAPDGVDTSFFGSDTTDPGSFPNFFGTSASAPAAAAAAALLLQQRPGLTGSDVRNLLMDSAIDMNNPGNGGGADPGFDFGTGAGLIQADAATGYASSLTFTADANHPALIGTHFNDTFVRPSNTGRHVLDGDAGIDTVNYSTNTSASGWTINLTNQVASSGGTVFDSLRNFENVIGPNIASTLIGDGSDNMLVGGVQGDLLDGGPGTDRLIGGTGDDQFFVDSAGDTVSELSGQGIDRVWTRASYALTSGAEIETFTTTNHAGTAAINLTGNTLGQFIMGNDGNNIIDTGGGADTMVGRLGDDQFFVSHSSQAVSEGIGGGIDRVWTTVSYALTAGSEIETFTTTNHAGTAGINLTGNSRAQLIVGNDGNNIIDGGGGADTMVGRLGDDQFFVSQPSQAVSESGGGGIDRVWTNVGYTLTAGSQIEIFTTTDQAGIAPIALTGNAFAQFIMGNDGNNVINGGAGSDTLVSRAGSDTYLFDTALGATNVDDLPDFNLGFDIFNLEDAAFSGLPLGTLLAAAFFQGSAAHDADDRIIYNSSTGALLFDADGTGGIAAQQFANIAAGLGIDNSYFIVV